MTVKVGRTFLVVILAAAAIALGMSVRVSFDWLSSTASSTGSTPSTTSTQETKPVDDIAPMIDLSRAFEQVAKAVVPSVVSLSCEGGSLQDNTGGSGIIVDASGVLVTNYHVIDGFDPKDRRIWCYLYNGGRVPVTKVIGYDQDSDVAVLQIDAENLKPAVLAGAETARVGQWVLAIGNAEGLEGTVTHGIISAVGRRGVIERSHTPDDLIQTDAAINRGNSGGPLVNLQGQVIGLNTLIYAPTGSSVGLGFAIPIDVVKRVVDDILQYGSVARGGLGVWSMLPESARRLGIDLDNVKGAVVGSVIPGSSAAKAGVEAGDLIVMYNGSEIHNFTRLTQLVAYTKPGFPATITIRRGKEWDNQFVLHATIGEKIE